MVQIVSIDSNTETLDRNRLARETSAPIGNNFQLALLHFRYCGRHAAPNVAPFGNLSWRKSGWPNDSEPLDSLNRRYTLSITSEHRDDWLLVDANSILIWPDRPTLQHIADPIPMLFRMPVWKNIAQFLMSFDCFWWWFKVKNKFEHRRQLNFFH